MTKSYQRKPEPIKHAPVPPPVQGGPAAYDEICSIIAGVDHVAIEMEAKWGVGRLELLVDDDLRLKFRRQVEKFNEASRAYALDRVRRHGEGMKKAWSALDTAAEKVEAAHLSPDIWEVEVNGRVIGIARTNVDAFSVTRSGRYMEVWTLDEVARIIENFPEIARVKQVFPGSLIEKVKLKRPSYDWAIGDEVPELVPEET